MNVKNIGEHLAVLFVSLLLGVFLGGLILMVLDIEYKHNDSYRLVYVSCALFIAPFITIQISKT